jgi:hypothetical protein
MELLFNHNLAAVRLRNPSILYIIEEPTNNCRRMEVEVTTINQIWPQTNKNQEGSRFAAKK